MSMRETRMGLFAGTSALITGADRGIGRTIALAFAAQGARVLACCRNDQDCALACEEIADKTGAEVLPFHLDLADENSVRECAQKVMKAGPSPEILVNNAGMAVNGTFMMTSPERLKEAYQVNFFSPVLLTQLVCRQMIRKKRGAVLNIASAGALEAGPGYLAYGGSKSSLIFATRVLAKELAPYGIRANAIAPGLTDTGMAHVKDQSEFDKVMARTPLSRLAKPEEIARAAVYLCSDEASFVTGEVLKVDGGRCA